MMHDQNIEAILEALEASDTLDALQEASEQLRDTYKIAHIVYHWVDSAGSHRRLTPLLRPRSALRAACIPRVNHRCPSPLSVKRRG